MSQTQLPGLPQPRTDSPDHAPTDPDAEHEHDDEEETPPPAVVATGVESIWEASIHLAAAETREDGSMIDVSPELGEHDPVAPSGLPQCPICGDAYDSNGWYRYVSTADDEHQGLLKDVAYWLGLADPLYHMTCWSDLRWQLDNRTLDEF